MYDELVEQLRAEGNWLGFTERLRDLFNPVRNPCKECNYFHPENNTCQSKKCATGGLGYITFLDRLLCKPYKLTKEEKK